MIIFINITIATTTVDAIYKNDSSEFKNSGTWFLMHAIQINPNRDAGACKTLVVGGGPNLASLSTLNVTIGINTTAKMSAV